MILAKYTEEEWEEINCGYYTIDMKYKHDYETLITKHNESKAFSIILESIKGIEISAFKVLGHSQKAFDILACYIGIKGMFENDVNAPLFQQYLECLDEYNFI